MSQPSEIRTFPEPAPFPQNPAMRQIITKLSTVVPLCFLAGCAISDDEEMKLAMQAIPSIERELGGEYPDEAVQKYVAYVGMSAVKHAGGEFQWQFKVLDSELINAFALPGGKIYITRGLLARLENEAQLASILGHEIGHVVRDHPVRQLERVQALQDGALMAAIVAGSSGRDSASAFTAAPRKYSRDQEREADLIGLKLMALAGYEPRAMLRTMEILDHGGGGGSGGRLSTHPSSDDRRQYLEEAIQSRYGSGNGKTEVERFRRIVFGF
jgi:predicted Zn-dependent protease